MFGKLWPTVEGSDGKLSNTFLEYMYPEYISVQHTTKVLSNQSEVCKSIGFQEVIDELEGQGRYKDSKAF